MAARISLPFSDGKEYIFVVMLGLFVGSIIGAMAQIIPYAMILLSGMVVTVLAWRQEGSISIIMIMVGLLAGSLFGNMAAVMPYGITLFLGLLLGMMIWRTQGGGVSTSGPTSTIALILFIIVSMGMLWNGTWQDFCNPTFSPTINACLSPQASGYITAWQGCVSTCTISAFTFLGNSPLGYLLNGDFLGFIGLFFSLGSQSPFNVGGFLSFVAAIFTLVIGGVLLVLGSGIGVSGDLQVIIGTGGGGSLQPNEAGTRLFQSLGVGLILWAAFTGLIFSGGWFQYLGFGLGTSGPQSIIGNIAAGGSVYFMFLTLYTFELYRQGKTITA